jgi:Ni,Fe-hydrogenase maturation factor
LPNTKLICLFQLTPELCLELLDATKIIFIDASFSNQNQYALACSLENSLNSNLSHHISPFTIIQTLKTLYKKDVAFEIYSILTSNFDSIKNNPHYEACIDKTLKQIISTLKNNKNLISCLYKL